MSTETALITGASSGIGMHLAHEFAAHGHPLVLVAPVQEELEAVAAQLTARYGASVRVIAEDLEKLYAAERISIALKDVAIEILVNNAGHGFRGHWWDLPIEKDTSMVRLNIEAALCMTKFFLPPMIQRGRGRILNTASIASFEPGPMLATYHATKAFVRSWSEALAIELEDGPITVTALCPGATDTDFFTKAGMVNTAAFQGQNLMAPQDVAKAGYAGMMKGELFVVPGIMNKALVAARRVLSEGAQARLNKKFYDNVPAKERKRHRGDVERKVEKANA